MGLQPSTTAKPHGRSAGALHGPDLLQKFLDLASRVLRDGRLVARSDDGREWVLGRSGPQAHIRIRDPMVLVRILVHPQLRFGEAYMDGEWEPEGSLLEVFEVAFGMMAAIEHNPRVRRLRALLARWIEANDPRVARRNVHHHYDLDADLYRHFLDSDMHYSCAYFREQGMSLEQAQQAKSAHIAAKLDLKPGMRVLDIGCGWGGLAMYLAERHGVQVTGITLSEEQYKVARERAAARGLQSRVQFRLQDYRDAQGEYDAIASVGMFEHVGRPQYARFFDCVRRLLKPDGTALIHTIGRVDAPGGTNAWIQKYIFPGGYIPAASEVTAPLERSGLILNDLEVWRLHYARTLAEWHRRFQANRETFRQRLGERFCRMWEFYLQGCEATFRWERLVVFQFQLSRQLERLPLTRQYLYGG